MGQARWPGRLPLMMRIRAAACANGWPGSRPGPPLGAGPGPDSHFADATWTDAFEQQADGLKFLIRDRDAKFSATFDAVLTAVGMRIVKTSVQAPART
jgi:hypothetical protein